MLTITRGATKEHLCEVYSDPYIQRVGHDHRAAGPVEHPLVEYLSAFSDDEFLGVFLCVKYSPIEFELHSLLKRSAVHYSRKLGELFLTWAFCHPIQRVTAYIIEGLESAKNYCIKLGFKVEGVRRNACMQDGKIKDVYVLGMTRNEWGAL